MGGPVAVAACLCSRAGLDRKWSCAESNRDTRKRKPCSFSGALLGLDLRVRLSCQPRVRLGLTRLARFHLVALLVGRCGSLSSLLHSTDMQRLGVTTLAGSIWGNKKAALV